MNPVSCLDARRTHTSPRTQQPTTTTENHCPLPASNHVHVDRATGGRVWTRSSGQLRKVGVPIGTTSPGGTRSHVCLTGSHGQTPRPRTPEGVYAEARQQEGPGTCPNESETGQAHGLSTTVPGAAPEGVGRTAPSARNSCPPTNRAPPGTREALVGRRGSPVASLALGRVIGQWGHRARHRGGATPGRLATRPRHVRAVRIVLEVGS
jgi:hypothetical protein